MANIIEARVKQKVDTLANWNANPMILLDGEQAFVINNAGAPVTFRIGDGTKRFSELPDFSIYTGDVPQKAPSFTINGTSGNPKIYIGEKGTYILNGTSTPANGDINYLFWNGGAWSVLEVSLTTDLLTTHTQWANEWLGAGAGRNYVFNSNGFLESGEIRWTDGAFGDISNISLEGKSYKTIRLNRPAAESRYIEFEFEYNADKTIKRVITHNSGY